MKITDIETINKLYKLYVNTFYFIKNANGIMLYPKFVKIHNKYDIEFQDLLLRYLNEFSYIFDKDLYIKLTELCESDDESNYIIALELIYEAHVKNGI